MRAESKAKVLTHCLLTITSHWESEVNSTQVGPSLLVSSMDSADMVMHVFFLFLFFLPHT